MNYKTDTPVALFVFNRPERTAKLMESISQVEPDTLLVVADGPREGNRSDITACRQTRQIVKQGVDWDCDFCTEFASTNLGIKDRFVSGLEWVFSETDEAIILEDDCLPNPDFFKFCDIMLDRYRGDKRVMDISGTNHLEQWKSDTQSYHFSMYGGIWGWATWKQSWEWYDPDMELWENKDIRERVRDVVADESQYQYLKYIYNQAYSGEIETWDYQWGFARNINSALSIVPSKNLVSNIGFGGKATNTRSDDSEWANIPRHTIETPIQHPDYVAVDRAYDEAFHQTRPISDRLGFLRRCKSQYRQLRKFLS